MTREQEEHVREIKEWIGGLIEVKYRKGQAEHGGNLWDKDVLPMLIDEIVDLVVYVKTLQDQLRKARYYETSSAAN